MTKRNRERPENLHEAIHAQSESVREAIYVQSDMFVEAINAQTEMFTDAIMKQSAEFKAQMRANRWWNVGTIIAVGLALAALIIVMWG